MKIAPFVSTIFIFNVFRMELCMLSPMIYRILDKTVRNPILVSRVKIPPGAFVIQKVLFCGIDIISGYTAEWKWVVCCIILAEFVNITQLPCLELYRVQISSIHPIMLKNSVHTLIAFHTFPGILKFWHIH